VTSALQLSTTYFEIVQNSSEVSFKIGLDAKKQEVSIDVKNRKEIILVSLILIFCIIM
jgi:hypothetical protein